jgi:hypothetical protein
MLQGTDSVKGDYLSGLDCKTKNIILAGECRSDSNRGDVPYSHLVFNRRIVAQFTKVLYITGRETVEHSINNGKYKWSEDRVYFK